MVLNEKKLAKMIEDAVTKALTVKIRMEKVRDDKTGMPLAVKETKDEDVFIPSFIAQLIPFYEGAMRGMQEEVNKTSNKMDKLGNNLQLLGDVIVQAEESLKCIAALSDHIKSIGFDPNTKYIEGSIDDGESDNS